MSSILVWIKSRSYDHKRTTSCFSLANISATLAFFLASFNKNSLQLPSSQNAKQGLKARPRGAENIKSIRFLCFPATGVFVLSIGEENMGQLDVNTKKKNERKKNGARKPLLPVVRMPPFRGKFHNAAAHTVPSMMRGPCRYLCGLTYQFLYLGPAGALVARQMKVLLPAVCQLAQLPIHVMGHKHKNKKVFGVRCGVRCSEPQP